MDDQDPNTTGYFAIMSGCLHIILLDTLLLTK